jgi:hypothetical protein
VQQDAEIQHYVYEHISYLSHILFKSVQHFNTDFGSLVEKNSGVYVGLNK